MKRTIISMFFSLALCVLPSLTHAEGIPPNQLPVWTGPTNATSTVGDLIEFTVTVEDPDNEPLVITTVLPDGASYDEPSGQFSWRPNTAGIHYARFNASDGRGSSLHKVTIEVTEHENHLPIFTGPESATTTVGALLEFTVTVSDPDGDLIDLSIMRPAGAIYATSTGLFSWTATATGTSTVMFSASDKKATTTHTTLINILAAPTPPQPPPPPTGGGGGGGGGGVCCPGNGP